MEANDMACLRCGGKMQFIMFEDIQLGKTSWVFGDWPNLLAGALRVAVYVCPGCGKIEFYRTGEQPEASETPQKICPKCGREHDFDYPKCPFCGYNYYG